MCIYVCDLCVCGLLVPSAPRGLRLSIVQDEPPVIAALWQTPRQPHGRLIAYRLRYGIAEDDQLSPEVRQLDAEKYRFTTGFLGQWQSINQSLVYYTVDKPQPVNTSTDMIKT